MQSGAICGNQAISPILWSKLAPQFSRLPGDAQAARSTRGGRALRAAASPILPQRFRAQKIASAPLHLTANGAIRIPRTCIPETVTPTRQKGPTFERETCPRNSGLTPCIPCRCASRAAPRPDRFGIIAQPDSTDKENLTIVASASRLDELMWVPSLWRLSSSRSTPHGQRLL